MSKNRKMLAKQEIELRLKSNLIILQHMKLQLKKKTNKNPQGTLKVTHRLQEAYQKHKNMFFIFSQGHATTVFFNLTRTIKALFMWLKDTMLLSESTQDRDTPDGLHGPS